MIKFVLPIIITRISYCLLPSFVPPWNLPLVEYCRYFSSTRNEMSDDLMRFSFLEHISNHKESILVFTDGSKSDAGVGFGVIFPNFNRSGRLPDQSSIFTAECFAIFNSLERNSLSS